MCILSQRETLGSDQQGTMRTAGRAAADINRSYSHSWATLLSAAPLPSSRPHLDIRPPRHRSAAVPHPAAGQLAVNAHRGIAKLAARPLESRPESADDRPAKSNSAALIHFVVHAMFTSHALRFQFGRCHPRQILACSPATSSRSAIRSRSSWA